MPLQSRRRGGSPNVAVPSGDLFPNGVDISPANADVQATVRPVGHKFTPSPGYETVRVGAHRLSSTHPTGFGIHFAPTRFAEDIAADFRNGPLEGPPALVDPSTASKHADIADLPGSEFLDDEGKLPAHLAHENRGTYLADPMDVQNPGQLRDMGDRDPTRPLSRAFYGLTRNPAGMLRSEWAENPVVAVAWGAAIVGVIYMLTSNAERSYRGRRGRGVAAATGAAAATVPAAAGATVKETAAVANDTLTAAGEAVETAVSAAGDAVEAAGEAVEKTTEAAADAVASD